MKRTLKQAPTSAPTTVPVTASIPSDNVLSSDSDFDFDSNPDSDTVPDVTTAVLLLDGVAGSDNATRGLVPAGGRTLISVDHTCTDLATTSASHRITIRISPAGPSARDVVIGLPTTVHVEQHVVDASCGLVSDTGDDVTSDSMLQAALNITAFIDNLTHAAPASAHTRFNSDWGGEAQHVLFQLEITFSASPGIEARDLADLLELTNGRVLESRENAACKGLQLDVTGIVSLNNPWVQNVTIVEVELPDVQSRTQAAYAHRPVAEVFAMDMLAMEMGPCTHKQDTLLIVYFSEPVEGFDASALEFGPGTYPFAAKAITGMSGAYHVYVGFNESFFGHTYVLLRPEVVTDRSGTLNLPSKRLEFTRIQGLPFAQFASYRLNASRPYMRMP
ncbi:hypothetical protein CYMTET_40825 [Cymbomonas tetramitiformis]|uniref:Uncharacterized protein n=1 Tax=Cymbomonas tetramitiformis TaxID=36881 RepID=A0AAE0C9G8_9CHLO|nr:hypothetical protein CYMTET_40825 [Cymbomonas tetramitiformis]